VIDKALIGDTAENVFLSLLNQRGVFATSFSTEGLDGIVFDPDHRLFKVGQSPYFVQVRSRNDNDIRTVRYFGIPFSSLDRFKTNKGYYNLSVKSCESAMREDSCIFRL
jgi:hypothetical protein